MSCDHSIPRDLYISPGGNNNTSCINEEFRHCSLTIRGVLGKAPGVLYTRHLETHRNTYTHRHTNTDRHDTNIHTHTDTSAWVVLGGIVSCAVGDSA